MTRRCSWCDAFMGETEGPDGETHGICLTCLATYFPAQAGQILRELKQRIGGDNEPERICQMAS